MKNKTTKKNGLYFYRQKKYPKGVNDTLAKINEYRWHIYRNGRIIAASSEGYKNFKGAENNLRSIISILVPYTIENKTVTEAVERFKKEKK